MRDLRWVVFIGVAAMVQSRYAFTLRGLERRRGTTTPTTTPAATIDVTALVIAHDEQLVIRETLAALREHNPGMRVVVADDGSFDDTARICRELATDDPLLKFLGLSRRGKMPCLREAVDVIQSALVVTVDADTLVTQETIPALVAALTAGSLSACSGSMRVRGEPGLVRSMQALEFALLNGDREALAHHEAVSILPGAMTIWRTEVLRALTREATNDIDLSFDALLAGSSLGYAREGVCTTSVPPSWVEVLIQRRRWARRKINRAGTVLRTATGRGVHARARLAATHLFLVHVVLALTAWWVDAWALRSLGRVLRRGHGRGDCSVLVAYACVLAGGATVARASDHEVGRPLLWLCSGPWERITRGIAAWSVVLWPRRNTSGWTPRR